MKQITTDHVLREWTRFCCAVAVQPLLITALELEEEQGLTIVVHEVDDTGSPIQCRDGSVVRRLALSFPHAPEETEWS